MNELLIRLDRILGMALRVFSMACLVALTLLLAANIISRATGLYTLHWFDEIVTTLFAWLVFIGASALWRERDHFAITLLSDYLAGGRGEWLQRLIIAMLGLLFAGVLLVYGSLFVSRSSATTPVLELPQAWAYACLPIAGLLMTVYALRDIWCAIRAARPGPRPAAPRTQAQ